MEGRDRVVGWHGYADNVLREPGLERKSSNAESDWRSSLGVSGFEWKNSRGETQETRQEAGRHERWQTARRAAATGKGWRSYRRLAERLAWASLAWLFWF